MRDPFLDNARFLLIVLVVFGHLLEPVLGRSHLALALYLWLYSFHMPAFVFLAGANTRPASWGARERTFGWALLVFQLAYMAVALLCRLPLAFPYWLLWFLLSLLYWRAAAALLVGRMPPSLILAVSVVLSVGAGYLPFGYTLTIKRTLVFSPFFFAGVFYGGAILDRMRSSTHLVKAAAVIAFVVAFAAAARSSLDVAWLYGTISVRHATPSAIPFWTMRLVLIAISATLSLAFLALTPSRTTAFTNRGRKTLVVYLLHGLVVIPLRAPIAHLPLPLAWTVILAAGGAMVLLFSSEVAKQTIDRWIVAPSFLLAGSRKLGNSPPTRDLLGDAPIRTGDLSSGTKPSATSPTRSSTTAP